MLMFESIAVALPKLQLVPHGVATGNLKGLVSSLCLLPVALLCARYPSALMHWDKSFASYGGSIGLEQRSDRQNEVLESCYIAAPSVGDSGASGASAACICFACSRFADALGTLHKCPSLVQVALLEPLLAAACLG